MFAITHYISLLRIDRSTGTFLLLWPTLWGVWIAGMGKPSLKIVIIFVLGSFVMRTAGCIINDLVDIKIDKHVKRTCNRVLTAGLVSKRHAVISIVVLLIMALALVSMLNIFSLYIASIALMGTIIYPFLKRHTNFVQSFLGIVFAFGILIAFAAIKNEIPLYGFCLYVVTIFWIVAYDTIYAIIDRKDDQKIGVYSTAILFGAFDRLWIIFFQILFIIGLIFLGITLGLGVVFFASILFAVLFFCYQHYILRTRILKAFKNNTWVGLSIFLGLFFSDYTDLIV